MLLINAFISVEPSTKNFLKKTGKFLEAAARIFVGIVTGESLKSLAVNHETKPNGQSAAQSGKIPFLLYFYNIQHIGYICPLPRPRKCFL